MVQVHCDEGIGILAGLGLAAGGLGTAIVSP